MKEEIRRVLEIYDEGLITWQVAIGHIARIVDYNWKKVASERTGSLQDRT